MDICSALLLLPGQPPALDRRAILAAGPYLPQHVAPANLPTEQLIHLSGQPQVPLPVAFQYAVLANDKGRTQALFHRDPFILRKDPHLNQLLATWSKEAVTEARRRTPNLQRQTQFLPALADPAAPGERLQVVATSLHGYISALDQVTWNGPLILKAGSETTVIARPWVPEITLTTSACHAECGAVLARLRLDLLASETHPWPQWFYDGIVGCYSIRANKTPPSPLAMAAIRKRAGQQTILACFDGTEDNQELATALVAPLLHSSRQHLLPRFIDILRQGSSSAEALRFIYQLDRQDFIQLHR